VVRVLLGVLQWTGIVLGGLAALVLLLTLFVLLSALTYSVRLDTTKGDKLRLSVTAKWLWNLLRVDYRLHGAEKRFRIRFFWKTIGKKAAGDETDSPESPSPSEDKAAKAVASDAKKVVKKAVTEAADEVADRGVAEAEKETDTPPKAEVKKESIFVRTRRQIDLFVNYPDKKLIWKYTKKFVLDTLCWLRPRRFVLRGTIGFDSPDITGVAIGAFGVARAVTGWDMNLKANFVEEEFALRGLVAGKLRLWTFAWMFLRYALRKPIWKILKPKLFKKKDAKKAKTKRRR